MPRSSVAIRLPGRAGLGLALLACLAPATANAVSWSLFGVATLAAERVTSQPSWLGGGFGRLSTGAASSRSVATHAGFDGRLGARLDLGPAWSAEVHGVARAEPESRGEAAGITEAFATFTHGLGAASELRLRAGLFFLPTTREAVEPLWTTPYTLTLSALNSWIGEEVRPSGVDAGVRLGEHAALGATLFSANDTAGALLAWRGWSLGDRLSVLGERLPLPALDSLQDPSAFAEQRRRAGSTAAETVPIGRELDGRIGWAARGRVEGAGALLQASVYDNRGDRELHDGEYAWRTRTQQAAVQWAHGPLTLIAEGLQGTSAMGDRTRAHVDIDLWAWYALASVELGAFRVSLRYDSFATRDRDHSTAENNDEYGTAWTVAGFWQPDERFRLGVEWLDLRSERSAAAESGFDANVDAAQWKLAARIRFE